MSHNIEKNEVIILLETSDKCKRIKAQNPKKAGETSQTIKGRPNLLGKASKVTC